MLREVGKQVPHDGYLDAGGLVKGGREKPPRQPERVDKVTGGDLFIVDNSVSAWTCRRYRERPTIWNLRDPIEVTVLTEPLQALERGASGNP